MPPRGSNTARMQLCGLSKARPISCSVCPAFQRLQTSRFSIEESPNRIPDLMPTPPLQSRFTSDGVASTYRMHRTYRELASTWTNVDFHLTSVAKPLSLKSNEIALLA